jgi:hypothetical protein
VAFTVLAEQSLDLQGFPDTAAVVFYWHFVGV